MNLKVPPGAQPPEFQIKRGGEQLSPLPEKNKTPLPPPPQELRPLDLDKTRPLPGKVLPHSQVHLCSYIPEQGADLPPKVHACAYIPEQGADLPPKLHACAYIPEDGGLTEETPQLRKRKQPLDLGELPCKPGGAQIYQCTTRMEPGRAQAPNIYQCTARIEPGKTQGPNIYQCVARLED